MKHSKMTPNNRFYKQTEVSRETTGSVYSHQQKQWKICHGLEVHLLLCWKLKQCRCNNQWRYRKAANIQMRALQILRKPGELLPEDCNYKKKNYKKAIVQAVLEKKGGNAND